LKKSTMNSYKNCKLCVTGPLKGYLQDPEGLGLMVAVTPFSGNKDKTMKLLKHMYKKGFIAFGCGKDPFRLRFLVPAIVESKDLDVACRVLEESILELKDT
jgi:4-aminobutyrate aminotransferase-like enzyme